MIFRVSKSLISISASSADETENKLSPFKVLYGEAPPERRTFFRLQVYERVGILLVEIFKRVGKSVIWVGEMAQRAEQMNFMTL